MKLSNANFSFNSTLTAIANEIPFLKTIPEKELLLGVIGALVLKKISISKAAEVMNMDKDSLLAILDYMNVEFSYLEANDVAIERSWL